MGGAGRTKWDQLLIVSASYRVSTSEATVRLAVTVNMSRIKDLNLTYEAINEEGTFSEGDTLAGTLAFTLTKDTKIKSLFVKAKGEAHVHWTEGSGDDERSYSAHRRYFKVKEFLLAENAQGTPPQCVSPFFGYSQLTQQPFHKSQNSEVDKNITVGYSLKSNSHTKLNRFNKKFKLKSITTLNKN